jgi:hypothetical protein
MRTSPSAPSEATSDAPELLLASKSRGTAW